jgi:hypothetical protein
MKYRCKDVSLLQYLYNSQFLSLTGRIPEYIFQKIVINDIPL